MTDTTPIDPIRDAYEKRCDIGWRSNFELFNAGYQAATERATPQWQSMNNLPPVDLSVGIRDLILWDDRLKTYRIGHPLLENTSDCTHFAALLPPPAIQQGGDQK